MNSLLARRSPYLTLLVMALACEADTRSIVLSNTDPDAGAAGSAGSAGSGAAGGGANAGSAATNDGGAAGSAQDSDASSGGSSGIPRDAGGGGVEQLGDANAPAAGAAGTESAPPPTFCQTLTPSAGIADDDHQCLDFESAVPDDWTPSVTGAASATVSEERAFSAPSAWRSAVPTAGDTASETEAIFSWSNVAAQGVAAVSVSMQVNPTNLGGLTPAWTGSIALACVEFGSGEVCVRYSRGGGPSNLFVDYIYTGGPAFLGTCQSAEDLSFQLWNELELTVGASGDVSLVVNGTSVLSGCSTSFLADTSANVRIGLASDADTGQAWSVFYDDIVVEIARQ